MLRILSIDDSKAVHAFIRQCLVGKKVALDDAFDGKEGIKFVIEEKRQFDLILLDWEMPEVDGLATLKAFVSNGVTSPIIMLTSKNKPEEIEQMLLNGASEYVMKPFTEDILVEKIESVVGSSIR